MKHPLPLFSLLASLAAAGCGHAQTGNSVATVTSSNAPTRTTPLMNPPVTKTEAEWKQTLTPQQYEVLRQKGTERAFTGEYWDHHGKGVYRCAGCGKELFGSDDKFDSGCGWPSFSALKSGAAVAEQTDTSHFMRRTEVLCSQCGGHLGHVFDDGPAPSGLRYCINSASLKFDPKTGDTNTPPARATGK